MLSSGYRPCRRTQRAVAAENIYSSTVMVLHILAHRQLKVGLKSRCLCTSWLSFCTAPVRGPVAHVAGSPLGLCMSFAHFSLAGIAFFFHILLCFLSALPLVPWVRRIVYTIQYLIFIEIHIYIYIICMSVLPLAPHKAVMEVSRKETYRRVWFLESRIAGRIQ